MSRGDTGTATATAAGPARREAAGLDVVRVRLLGGLAVDGRSDHELGSRKGRTLLKALAVAAGAPVPIDQLCDVVWGDDLPARPGEQLAVLVSRLRSVLGGERVVREDAGYRLVVDWLDTAELDVRVDEAASALAEGRVAAGATAAAAAVALARGELLPGDDGDWVTGRRAAIRVTIARAHQLAAEAALSAGDPAAGAASAEAALASDPYDEVALRTLMRAHLAAGRPASGLAAYVRVRDRVADDLGIDLTPETEALHDELVLASGAPASHAAPLGVAGPPAPRLAGRQPELARLGEILEQVVAAGRAEVVVVRGEPGIGKTALVSAFAAGCLGRATVLRGRCDELGRDLPLQPVADAVAIVLRGTDPPAAAELLGAEVRALAGVLGLDHGHDSPTVPDTEAGRATLFAALLAVVERTGHGGPVVLVIDDLHLAGPSTLAWLTFAVRRGGPILLLACSRPDSELPAGARSVDLDGLDETAAAGLLAGSDPARVTELHRRSGGNPLLLLALAARPADDLPTSVRQAAEALAASVGPDVVATVRAAAVLGNDIDLDLLAEVLHRPALDVLTDLEAAHRAGLLDDRSTGLTFRHELVREALEATTTVPRRALVHRDAARALAARPVADVLAVAVHARLGGDVALAVDSYVAAASGALARFDTDGALTHLDAAIALGGSADAFALRARVRMATLGLEEAARDALEAVARGGGAPALEVSGWVAYYRRRYDEARAFADQGVVAAGDDVALRASCLAVAGRVRHARGDLAGATERFSSAEGAPAPVQGVIDVWLGYAREHEGRPAEALHILERPLVAPDQLAHPWAGLHGRFVRVKALGELGRVAEGLAACDDLALANARAGAVGERLRGPALNVRSWLLRHAGLRRDADDCSTSALELTSGPDGGPSSDAVSEFHYVALLDLADGRLLTGDVDGTASLLDRAAAIDTWEGTMAWHQRHRLWLSRARLALLTGDEATAAEQSAMVAADAADRGAGRYEALGRAWLALAGGDGDLERIQATIDRLATVAALEGWWLVARLGDRFDVSTWRADASARAGRLVAAAGPLAVPLRRVVAEVFA